MILNPLRGYWSAAVVGVFLLGCSEPGDSPQGEVLKERVRGYLQTLVVDENWSEWTTYFSPDASMNGSDFALQIMRGTASGLHFSFGDLGVDIGEQVAEADLVATRFTFRGIHERPFNDQPATNLPVELGGFVIDRFEDGRVIESRMLLDVWGLSQRTAAAGANEE